MRGTKRNLSDYVEFPNGERVDDRFGTSEKRHKNDLSESSSPDAQTTPSSSVISHDNGSKSYSTPSNNTSDAISYPNVSTTGGGASGASVQGVMKKAIEGIREVSRMHLPVEDQCIAILDILTTFQKESSMQLKNVLEESIRTGKNKGKQLSYPSNY